MHTNCRACGAYITLEDGKAVKIASDKAHPISKGYLCRKARGFIQDMQYHKARQFYPQKRLGKKGEGKWKRITWDEALTTIAEKFNQIKAENGVGDLWSWHRA